MPIEPKVPPQGRFNRFRKLASLSAQVGTEVLARGVKRLAGAEAPLLSKGAAEKLVSTLGVLKGVAMKFGQAASMDPDMLSPEVRTILSRLQNEAPPMPYATVVEVIEEEFGKPPQALFSRFDAKPLAAASLGQVHRAALFDGREVVVKIQYPGVRESMTSDLDNLGALVRALSRASHALDGKAYYQELRDEMLLEVDYRREAALCEGFARAVAKLPQLKVPEVISDRTGHRVLTLEFLEGKTLKDWVQTDPSPAERFRISRLLIHAVYGPFFLDGEIHADPHPGNFIVMPDGRLGVVDFGSVKRFSPAFVEANLRMFKDARSGKPFDVLAVCKQVGFSIELPDELAAELVGQVLHTAGRALQADDYDYAQDDVSRDLKKLFAEHASKFLKIRPPSEAVMFFRATGGCTQNLKVLKGRGNFKAVFDELATLLP